MHAVAPLSACSLPDHPWQQLQKPVCRPLSLERLSQQQGRCLWLGMAHPEGAHIHLALVLGPSGKCKVWRAGQRQCLTRASGRKMGDSRTFLRSSKAEGRPGLGGKLSTPGDGGAAPCPSKACGWPLASWICCMEPSMASQGLQTIQSALGTSGHTRMPGWTTLTTTAWGLWMAGERIRDFAIKLQRHDEAINQGLQTLAMRIGRVKGRVDIVGTTAPNLLLRSRSTMSVSIVVCDPQAPTIHIALETYPVCIGCIV